MHELFEARRRYAALRPTEQSELITAAMRVYLKWPVTVQARIRRLILASPDRWLGFLELFAIAEVFAVELAGFGLEPDLTALYAPVLEHVALGHPIGALVEYMKIGEALGVSENLAVVPPTAPPMQCGTCGRVIDPQGGAWSWLEPGRPECLECRSRRRTQLAREAI